eukprot:GHUV01043127.1.p1 GENE.GHUV01043127.1~~GHUV01043127.1.p1  ORF type:complete len:143 (+),score=51.31 GHUV01043127.1:206-634(+)
MRTQQPLALRAAAGPSGLKVWLHCDSMELAGELLQDLASYLGVDELSSTASFPAVMDQFRNTLSKVEACSAARAHVEGDTATLCANIKACVVRAEDARLLGDMAALKRQHRWAVTQEHVLLNWGFEGLQQWDGTAHADVYRV